MRSSLRRPQSGTTLRVPRSSRHVGSPASSIPFLWDSPSSDRSETERGGRGRERGEERENQILLTNTHNNFLLLTYPTPYTLHPTL
jgi:hypothetical protein